MIYFVSMCFSLFQVVLYSGKSWLGLFVCDAYVILTSFGCCTLFQAVLVFVCVVSCSSGCLKLILFLSCGPVFFNSFLSGFAGFCRLYLSFQLVTCVFVSF